MEDFVRGGWTYLRFDPIKDSENQFYAISLEFEYEGASALMRVFEVDSKRSFLFRVLEPV